MARSVVDDEEELAGSVLAEQELQEFPKGRAVEDGRKLVTETCIVQGEGAEDVSGLAHPVRVDPRLHAYTAPGLVKRAIQPEARFVLEEDYPSARSRFFLMAGNVFRSQNAWACTSARASRLRGRCTEKPSWWSIFGMWCGWYSTKKCSRIHSPPSAPVHTPEANACSPRPRLYDARQLQLLLKCEAWRASRRDPRAQPLNAIGLVP